MDERASIVLMRQSIIDFENLFRPGIVDDKIELYSMVSEEVEWYYSFYKNLRSRDLKINLDIRDLMIEMYSYLDHPTTDGHTNLMARLEDFRKRFSFVDEFTVSLQEEYDLRVAVYNEKLEDYKRKCRLYEEGLILYETLQVSFLFCANEYTALNSHYYSSVSKASIEFPEKVVQKEEELTPGNYTLRKRQYDRIVKDFEKRMKSRYAALRKRYDDGEISIDEYYRDLALFLEVECSLREKATELENERAGLSAAFKKNYTELDLDPAKPLRMNHDALAADIVAYKAKVDEYRRRVRELDAAKEKVKEGRMSMRDLSLLNTDIVDMERRLKAELKSINERMKDGYSIVEYYDARKRRESSPLSFLSRDEVISDYEEIRESTSVIPSTMLVSFRPSSESFRRFTDVDDVAISVRTEAPEVAPVVYPARVPATSAEGRVVGSSEVRTDSRTPSEAGTGVYPARTSAEGRTAGSDEVRTDVRTPSSSETRPVEDRVDAGASSSASTEPEMVTVSFVNCGFPITGFENLSIPKGASFHGPAVPPVKLNDKGKPKLITLSEFHHWEDAAGNVIDPAKGVTKNTVLIAKYKHSHKKGLACGFGIAAGITALGLGGAAPLVGAIGFNVLAHIEQSRLNNLLKEVNEAGATVTATEEIPENLKKKIDKAKRMGHFFSFLRTSAISCTLSIGVQALANKYGVTAAGKAVTESATNAASTAGATVVSVPSEVTASGANTLRAYYNGIWCDLQEGQTTESILQTLGAPDASKVSVEVMNASGGHLTWQPLTDIAKAKSI